MTDDPITAGPPRDVETETKALACLFLLRPAERADLLERISAEWFYDPTNVWLFRGLRVWGVIYDGPELYEQLANFPDKPTSDSIACIIALTVFLRDGSNRVRYQMLPYYLTQLQTVYEKRQLYDQGIAAIIANYHHDPFAGDWTPH